MIGIILSLLFFIFTPKVLANDVSISWISVPNSASLSTQFDVQVKVTASKAGTYYLSADNKGDGGCTMQLKKESTGDWSNGCYIGISEMQPITINSDGGSGTEILRLKEISSSGIRTFYSYVYDVNKTLLSTSTTGSITINAITPTLAVTSTPTPTPTLAVTSTPTPTPTKILTPTPTEAPIIEPTQALIETTVPTIEVNKEDSETTEDSKKSGKNYLPIIFIIFGLLMFTVPFLGPKIAAKIKFKKREQPPMIPPFTGLNS